MIFAQRLKELRTEKGLTQDELSKKTGLSHGCIAMLEIEKRAPTAQTLYIFADFFQVSTDYLLGRSDDFGIIQTAKPQDELTKEERELILDYRALTPALQKMLRATIETWKGSDANAGAKKNNKNTVAF